MPANTDPWAAIQQELADLREQVKNLQPYQGFWQAWFGDVETPRVPEAPAKPRRITMKTPPEDLTHAELVAYVKRLRKRIVAMDPANWRSGPG